MQLRSEAIDRWWPTTQALDLVEGGVEAVAQAVHAEVSRFLKGDPVATKWRSFPHLDAAFGAAPRFANVPTFYLVVPTRSKWTVLWNNSSLCDGYDSLCWCLTQNHGFTSLHWSAHDNWTTFQSGAAFTHRRLVGSTVAERSVYCGQEDKRWLFRQSGEPLPEESLETYALRRKRDRLNEAILAGLLARLGARPWSEDFYALPERPCFLLERKSPPSSVIVTTREEVLGRANNQMRLTPPAQVRERRS